MADFPNTTHRVAVRDLEELISEMQFMEVASVQGVGSSYHVYAPIENDEMKFFVIEGPTDGPIQAFTRFANSTQDAPAYFFGSWEFYREGFEKALNYVTARAVQDLKDNS